MVKGLDVDTAVRPSATHLLPLPRVRYLEHVSSEPHTWTSTWPACDYKAREAAPHSSARCINCASRHRYDLEKRRLRYTERLHRALLRVPHLLDSAPEPIRDLQREKVGKNESVQWLQTKVTTLIHDRKLVSPSGLPVFNTVTGNRMMIIGLTYDGVQDEKQTR